MPRRSATRWQCPERAVPCRAILAMAGPPCGDGVLRLVESRWNSGKVEGSIPFFGTIAMDRLDELSVFTAILDAGSLAAAARRLHRSPPAVTRSLAALEERLGVRLVERTTRRLAPTHEGRRFAEEARRI